MIAKKGPDRVVKKKSAGAEDTEWIVDRLRGLVFPRLLTLQVGGDQCCANLYY